MKDEVRWRVAGAVIAGCALVAGCAIQTARYYSSVVEYLYPGTAEPAEKPEIPVMTLPMKVGVAFVPNVRSEQRGDPLYLGPARPSKPPVESPLSEQGKMDLMQEVSGRFRELPFIASIELIPSPYLTRGGSFTNLDQIRTMYGVDAMALLSYDQVQFTDEGAASFLYWTIIGAYVVPGEKNTTQTMLDAVVYDIKSRKMLFRAPGVSQVKGSATPVNLTGELRRDSEQGFREAAKDLVANLDTQLKLFQEKVKQQPEQYRVVRSQGYSGGGNLGWLYVALLALGGAGALLFRRL